MHIWFIFRPGPTSICLMNVLRTEQNLNTHSQCWKQPTQTSEMRSCVRTMPGVITASSLFCHFPALESVRSSASPGMISVIPRLAKMSVTDELAPLKATCDGTSTRPWHQKCRWHEGRDRVVWRGQGVPGSGGQGTRIESNDEETHTNRHPGHEQLQVWIWRSASVRVWKACDVGPGKYFPPDQLTRFGTPQGPTNLGVLQPVGLPGE